MMKNNMKIGISIFALLVFSIMAYSSTEEGNQDGEKEKSEETISTVKVGNLEVMTKDIGMLTWSEAMDEASKKGDGWRVPTTDELLVIYENRDRIPNLGAFDTFWSSEEEDRYNALQMTFSDGRITYYEKNVHNCVRLVRKI